MRCLTALSYFALVLTLNLFAGTDAVLGYRNQVECPRQRESYYSIQIYLSVSSLVSASLDNTEVIQRQLELNWKYNASEDNDWVALYDTNPSNISEDAFPLEVVKVVDYPDGFYRTSVEFPRYNFSEDDFQENRCLDYWMAYGRNETILKATCIQIRPQWMWNLRNIIGNSRLSDLMIPGTHNAGSYQRYRGQRSENIFIRYNIYQEEDIGTQLMYGIRHFDFRIGFYKLNAHQYWLNHDHVKLNPFAHAIEHIKLFVQNSKDILFLDFHRFPVGFKNRIDRHSEFMAYLLEELGDYLVPRSVGYYITLNELWRMNRTVVIFYSSENYVLSPFFWPGLPQVWANTNRISRLITYFRNYVSKPKREPLWSAMAELTPTIWDAITTPKGSLRILADEVNRHVTHWFRDGWWREANIVATDFFLGNNMIEVAVEANRDRVLCQNQTLRHRTIGVEMERKSNSTLTP